MEIMGYDNLVVMVNCMTYNQSQYIEDALNGFVMQQTSFPFVCLVMDDASTDGEQNVIRDFLRRECDMAAAKCYDIEESDVMVLPHKTNKNCTFAVYFLKKNLYGTDKKEPLINEWRKKCKYEALCEGDDYWIDSLKLQKQVDFLKSNPEYSMCCSDAEIITPDGELSWTRYQQSQRVSPQDMIRGGGLYVQTASLLFRTDLWNNYPSYCVNCHVGDYPLKIWGAVNGGLYWFAEKMVVYRYMAEGSWSKKVKSAEWTAMIPKWRSEIEMLRGIDDYTDHKYNDVIEFHIAEYIFSFMLNYPDKRKLISSNFQDCAILINTRMKIINFLMDIKLLWMYKIWCWIRKNRSAI